MKYNPDDKDHLLILAVNCNNLERVKNALEEGARINARDEQDLTPLHLAVRQGYTDIVTLLLAHPEINVNVRAGNNTPLYEAVRQSHTKIVTLLLARPQIDVNAKGEYGCTPLYKASQFSYYKSDIVALLLDHPQIDVNVQKSRFDHDTPLHIAAYLGNTDAITQLLAHPALRLVKNKAGQTAISQKQHAHLPETMLQQIAQLIRCGRTKNRVFLSNDDAADAWLKLRQGDRENKPTGAQLFIAALSIKHLLTPKEKGSCPLSLLPQELLNTIGECVLETHGISPKHFITIQNGFSDREKKGLRFFSKPCETSAYSVSDDCSAPMLSI